MLIRLRSIRAAAILLLIAVLVGACDSTAQPPTPTQVAVPTATIAISEIMTPSRGDPSPTERPPSPTMVADTPSPLPAQGSGENATPAATKAAAVPTPLPAVLLPGFGSKQTQVLGQSSTLDATQQKVGPPKWVKAGTRVTFYSAAASVAQSRFAWVEDPNGDWRDPTTGKKYRRTDEGPDAQGVPTASGDGFAQVDVLAVEGTDVVLSVNLYGIDHEHNILLPGSTSGAKVAGAAVDGTWINPTLLAQLQKSKPAGMLVLTGDYVVGGVKYKAVSFATTGAGAYQQYTYDTQTGLLISATTSTPGATSPLAAPGEGAPKGNTQLTVTQLLGYRQRTLPGINGTNPSWLARTSQLHYTGTYNWTNPVDPSSGTYTYPMDLKLTLSKGGKNWAPYKSTVYIQLGSLQPTNGSGVTGTTGLYWMDLTALKSLKAGQVLDQDKYTGERLTVAKVGTGSGATVVIDSQLPGITYEVTYDKTSGAMLAYEQQVQATGATIQLQIEKKP
jgi:hypothetical protein